MKLLALTLACLLASSASPSGALSAEEVTTTLPPKKKKLASKAKPANAKMPTTLPAYKGKKKVQVDFEENSGTHTTTVIVRQPLPLEKALNSSIEERIAIEQKAIATSQATSQVKPSPLALQLTQPEPAPTPKTVLRPAPISQLTAKPSAPPSLPPTPTRSAPPAPTPILTNEQATLRSWGNAYPESPQPNAIDRPSIVPIENRPAQVSTPPAVQVSAEKQFIAKYRSAEVAPAFSTEVTRFYARAAYLAAHYSGYAGELQDGATSFALGLSHQWDRFEGRATVEVGHGLDQEFSAQNIRYLLVRADASYLFLPGSFTPFAGAGLGYGSANLRSYRSQDGNTITLREHAKATTLIVTPAAGLRFTTDSNYTFDLTAEYLVFVGGGTSSDLGGWTGAFSVGIPF